MSENIQASLQTLAAGALSDRLEAIRALGDEFDFKRDWQPGEAEAVTQHLLNALETEHDFEQLEALIRTLLLAYSSGELIVLPLEPLLSKLDFLPSSLWFSVLEILYLSGDERYQAHFKQLLRHPEPELRRLAAEKLRLLKGP